MYGVQVRGVPKKPCNRILVFSGQERRFWGIKKRVGGLKKQVGEVKTKG